MSTIYFHNDSDYNSVESEDLQPNLNKPSTSKSYSASTASTRKFAQPVNNYGFVVQIRVTQVMILSFLSPDIHPFTNYQCLVDPALKNDMLFFFEICFNTDHVTKIVEEGLKKLHDLTIQYLTF